MRNSNTRLKSVIRLALIGLVGAASAASAYDFRQADANKLAGLVAESLADLRADKRPSQLAEIQRLFRALDRGSLDGEGLVELKYLLSMYRRTVVALRLKRLAGAGEQETDEIVEDLGTIGGFLSRDQAKAVLKATEGRADAKRKALLVLAKHADPKAARDLIAKEGDAETNLLAGPRELLLYDEASFSKDYGNDLWLGKPGLDSSAYRMTGKYSAIVHGIEVRSGDLLFLDQGKTGGINTNFSIPRSYATHCGLIVFLEKAGKVYPAFFEIAERGLRVIPLNSALAAPFTLYGEVYRPAGKPNDLWIRDFPAWAERFGADVLSRLKVKYFYDYYVTKIRTGDETDVVCSTQIQAFLLRAGIKLDLKDDKTDERAKKSLQSQFQYGLEEYVTPTSFLRAGSSQIYFVGAVETGMAAVNTARELVIGAAGETSPGSLGFFFSHYDLDLKKLSPEEVKQKFSLFQLVAPGFMLSGKVQVKAPVAVLAFAKVLETPLKEAVEAFEADFEKTIHATDSFEPFSLHEKAKSPAFVEKLEARTALIRAWFR